MSKQKKQTKPITITKTRKILFLILIPILLIEIILVSNKVYNKYFVSEKNNKFKETAPKETLKKEEYNYILSSNASKYEEELFQELKNTLSKDEINEEEYAKNLAKIFISDVFTMSTKKSSSDITSSQYVYTDYQETYKTMIKETIYSSIELNLDGKREQKLPTVTNVEINTITRETFSTQNDVLDQNAFHITATITYEENLNYPTNYELILVKNKNILQVVKAKEV